jgi:uncharacterized repeat protein (TIGR03803 family)
MRRAPFLLPLCAVQLAALTCACGDGSASAPANEPAPPAVDGLAPVSLIEGRDGNLYGVTQLGGDFGFGTVFKATPQGQESVLYSFAGGTADGANPLTLLQGSDGNLYGITGSGGVVACQNEFAPLGSTGLVGCGVVFAVTPDGMETVLYSFSGGADGGLPTALVQAGDGYLYGVAGYGGIVNAQTRARGGGVVFRLMGPGAEQVVYAFDGSRGAGQSPQSLMQGTDGSFYVTTGLGGAANWGAIVHITTDGAGSVLYSFQGGADGELPSAPLIAWSDGNFYGVTAFGGANGGGTFFRLTPAGQETVVYQFGTSAAHGLNPWTLIAGSGGQLFGVTSSGGLMPDCGGGGCGTVYQITPAGAESALYQFGQYTYENLVTASDVAAVIQSADGTLYGVTSGSGIPTATEVGGGTLFSLSPGGVLTTLHEFGSGTP